MKPVVLIGLFILSFAVVHPCFSQKQIEISGVKYILHTAEKGESVFTLCKKYHVGQIDLLKANPGLPAVLKAGTIVKVPVISQDTSSKKDEQAKAKVEADNGDEYYYHKVEKKQTIFSIARQYGITVNDLIRYNPEITKGITEGQVLKIPVDITNDNTPENSFQPDVSEYTVHPVVSGETLYSLEQLYGVSNDELLKFNPALQSGLKAGMKLKVPVKKASAEPVQSSFTKYKVEKGETLFSLASRFGIGVEDIKKANPSLLSRSPEVNETILIPQPKTGKAPEKKTSAPDIQSDEPQSSDCNSVKVSPEKKFKVALLLPFFLEGSDNSTTSSVNKALLMSKINVNQQAVPSPADTVTFNGANVDQRAAGFLEFYEGVLLAVDSLQQKGQKIELYTFDASNQKMINALLQLDDLRQMDLIIGPVYSEFQESVAAFSARNHIPMISPLASTGNFEQNNSWYFKVNPGKEYLVDQTAMYVGNQLSGKNFILLKEDGNSNSLDVRLAQLCKEKLSAGSAKKSFHEYDLKQGINAITPLLSETDDNVFLLPTDSEAQVSIAVTNLDALAEHYNIILLGSQVFTKLKSIQPENFHKIRLRYLSPYFVDYSSPLVRRFIGKYRELFSAEPSQFSFQGFDVAFYFFSALQRFGKDFRKCLPSYPMELTQTSFGFSKVSSTGGFVNCNLFITSYERDFDILNLGIFPKGIK
jgi:LysM repeat protein/ABC-type branched-subunit amino acid transport system substrate-binding protein